jgi:hypothetical protein
MNSTGNDYSWRIEWSDRAHERPAEDEAIRSLPGIANGYSDGSSKEQSRLLPST